MIAYINGVLAEKSNNYVIVETSGVGYKIFMPINAIKKLPEIGQKAKIHTYYYVREDNISLYGFNNLEELKMFELLISVSGIGAKSAIIMISEITPSKFAIDVISGDVSSLIKIPGIGKKTAQRIILELKDKLKTESAMVKENLEIEDISEIKNNSTIDEAIAALQVLGYQKREIENAFSKMNLQDMKLEDMIKQALAILSK